MSTVLPVRTPRVLACVLCQHRKIKCDRNTPCSNCLKANVTCTPSTPAPARKRRRPNQDLQQRLARCEELLQEYATAKPSPASNETPSADDRYKTVGKLIDDDGSVRFMDSFLWANVHDELRAMREILDSDDKDDESCSTPADGQTPDQHTALLFSDGSNESLEDLHPEPAHVFRLWQTFVDRVNPLTKVIHVPTIQPLLVEAATNRAALPKNVEALLFAIYTMAAVALSDNESLSMLGCTKEQAFDRFSKGVRIALMRIGILNKYDLVVLQAMVLYLVSLSGRYDRHAAWVLNGVIVRIAQKMGLHRDGTTLGLSPFETEIRRRLWWQIILLDCTYALMSGLTHSPLPRNWDTKKPTNINDADLFPTMKSIEEREGPTDMIFILISYEIAQLLLEAPGFESLIHQNEQGLADKPTNTDVETARARIEELNQRLTEILTQYGDLSLGPVHEFSMQLCPMMVRKMQELICPPREQPEWGTEVLTPKDHLFKIAVQEGEHSLGLYEITQKRGTFLWFVMTHFQVEVFHFMTGYLNMRTTGQLVERAWVVTEQTYKFHTELFNLSVKPHASLAIFVLRAWRKREDMLREIKGFPPERPYYITQLMSLLESDGATKEETPFDQSLPDVATPDKGGIKGVEMPWDNMLGFVDASTIDWSTFGETVPQATGFPSFGQGGASGWM